MFMTTILAQLFKLTTECATLRALVKLQGSALEKSTRRADRLSDELAVAQRELRDAVEEIETSTRAHNSERERWSARVAELVAEADRERAALRELRTFASSLESSARLLASERDHWKARATGATAEASS